MNVNRVKSPPPKKLKKKLIKTNKDNSSGLLIIDLHKIIEKKP